MQLKKQQHHHIDTAVQNKNPLILLHTVYSILKLFTGFETAALIACILIVKNAIKKAVPHASTIIHTLNGALYAKLCSQLFTKYQATGVAIKNEINTSFKKSLDKSDTIPAVFA